MQERLNVTMDSFEMDKNKTKELIQRAKDFLMGASADRVASTLMETTSLPVFPPSQMRWSILTTLRRWPEQS